MSNEDSLNILQDFVYWVRKRRPFEQDAWVNEQTLEYVTRGIERFLDGKNPWPKRRGRKPDLDTTWNCYYLTNFVNEDQPFLPQHTAEGGAFNVVGKRLKLSAEAVESQTRKARHLLKTVKGRRTFEDWLTKHKNNGLRYGLFPPDHPSTVSTCDRRKALGLRNGYSKAGRKPS